jgi:predicted esterase
MNLPHQNGLVLTAGADLENARTALILLHGRGAMAQDILSLSADLTQPGLAFLAPQAQDFTWYPDRFIAPLEQNEPYLSGALAVVDDLVQQVQSQGIPAERIFLGGFSQGACLATEYVVRNPKRYGGLLIFSGGYIGPLNEPRLPGGDLQGTPVFLGCSDPDPHIPLQRVRDTISLLRAMGAHVTEEIYPNMGHTIIQAELDQAAELLNKNS